MMPPKHPHSPPPPGTPVAPYPYQILALGGGRWLTATGEVITKRPARQCGVTSQTLWFWERAAVRGGHILSELMG